MSEKVYIPSELALSDQQTEAVEQSVAMANLSPSLMHEFGEHRFNWKDKNNTQGIYEGPSYSPEDESQLTVVGLPPFANNFPHNRMRDGITAAAINYDRTATGIGSAAAIHVANNTRQTPTYEYSDEDIESLKQGTFSPFADRLLRMLEERGARGPVLLSGQSQGGSVALAIADRIRNYHEVVGVAATEPTTFIDQTTKQQQKAFMKGGLPDMNAAVLDSGVDAVQKMLRVKDTPKQTLPQLLNTLSFAWGAMTKDNDAIKEAMASDRGFEDLRDLDDAEMRVTIMSGAASLILPESVMLELQEEFSDSESTSIIISYGSAYLHDKKGNVKPHGHGIGDNIAAVAGLAIKVTE